MSILDMQKDLIANEAKGANIYAIIDSAIYKEFHRILELEDRMLILLKEPYLHGYERVAPYLVSLDLDSDPVSDKLIESARGGYWLTFVVSSKGISELANELRDMIVVYSQKHEREIVYRFYDPRHLHNYILIHSKPALNTMFKEEIEGFFMTMHSEDPTCFFRFDTDGITPVCAEEKA